MPGRPVAPVAILADREGVAEVGAPAAPGTCERCGETAAGLLCPACTNDAPPAVRLAFGQAVGIDAMRAAVERVRAYARPAVVRLTMPGRPAEGRAA
ncbi:MAG TPA: hypothetical protein VGO11_19685 [Chthoniobacteraceae bacterium]|nr:hypothetical protein [Chthoniobacteraceae bacterium]